jgi:hypothetical protein
MPFDFTTADELASTLFETSGQTVMGTLATSQRRQDLPLQSKRLANKSAMHHSQPYPPAVFLDAR